MALGYAGSGGGARGENGLNGGGRGARCVDDAEDGVPGEEQSAASSLAVGTHTEYNRCLLPCIAMLLSVC